MASFKLTISLGAPAMRNADDVARVLERVAAQLRRGVTSSPVLDAPGGAQVGTWQLTSLPQPKSRVRDVSASFHGTGRTGRVAPKPGAP